MTSLVTSSALWTLPDFHGRGEKTYLTIMCSNDDLDLLTYQFSDKLLPDTKEVLQTIQMKLILLCVWAEPAVLGSAKTALKFNYEISIGYYLYNSMYGAVYKLQK